MKVELFVGNYKDKVLCDVVPMEACHILLGRPWQFDKKTMHNGFTNEITFIHKETLSLTTLPSCKGPRANEKKKRKKN